MRFFDHLHTQAFRIHSPQKLHRNSLNLPASSISNKRQIRSPTQNGRSQTINEAQNAEDEQSAVSPNHDPETQSRPAGAENPLDEEREDEEDVESDGLHGIEPDVAAEARVSDDAEVKGEEGDEAGVRDGPVEGNDWEEGVEEEAQFGVLEEEVAAVLEGIEEGEGVGDGGDEAVGGWGGGGGRHHANATAS